MKKVFLIFLGTCFFIFSCASTNQADAADDSQTSPEIISEETTDETSSTGSATNSSDADSSDDETYELPPDFEEPYVQDLELPQETITDDSEGTDSVSEEPISTDEIELEPVENSTETDSDIISTEIEINEEDIPVLETDETENIDSDTDTENSEISTESDEENPDEEGLSTDEETSTDSENSEFEDSDETDEESDYEQEILEEETEEQVIMPSRSVTLKRGENLEIVYPGSGWIYMGSLSEYSNLASRGRKLGATDTKYTLLAKEAGTQIHHFYKVDNLTGEYIDDYIEVTVLDKKGSSKTTVTAPAYEYVIPPKPQNPAKSSENEEEKAVIIEDSETENEQEDTIAVSIENTIEETTVDTIEIDTIDVDNVYDTGIISVDEEYGEYSGNSDISNAIDTDTLLESAKNLYNEQKYQEANILLAVFFVYSTHRIDEGLFLQGQIYEADSEIKNIKKSIENYEALIKNYPSSEYWSDANKRIKYLRRFYYLSN